MTTQTSTQSPSPDSLAQAATVMGADVTDLQRQIVRRAQELAEHYPSFGKNAERMLLEVLIERLQEEVGH